MPLAFLGATVENVRCTFLWQQGGVASLPVAPPPSVPSGSLLGQGAQANADM